MQKHSEGTWTTEAPQQAGAYWVRFRHTGQTVVAQFARSGTSWSVDPLGSYQPAQGWDRMTTTGWERWPEPIRPPS
jgi:hypothetical protein